MPLTDITAEAGAALLTSAETMEKKPYFDDGGPKSSPEKGFDCSGLLYYIISTVGKYNFDYRSVQKAPHLAHHPMLRRLKIPSEALRAGDIVLFHKHVGFYDPDPEKPGKTLYSATSHGGVHHEDPKFFGHPVGYYRLQVVAP